jgi:hypothetical protein
MMVSGRTTNQMKHTALVGLPPAILNLDRNKAAFPAQRLHRYYGGRHSLDQAA